MEIGKNLMNILTMKDISIQDLADMSGIPLETIRSICYGKSHDPRISTVFAICKALEIDINSLLGELSYEHSKECQIIRNYYKCGNHGKAIIEVIARKQAMAAEVERNDQDKHIIECVVPTTPLPDGINNATCNQIKIETTVKDAYLGYKIINNNFIDHKICMGDVILLQYRNPQIGEKAVFSNGVHSYFRILEKEDNMWLLKPMNKQGKPIYCKRLDEWICIGVCIDVIRV